MGKAVRRSIGAWLILAAAVLVLFGPTMVAGADGILDWAMSLKGEYTWCPSCLE